MLNIKSRFVVVSLFISYAYTCLIRKLMDTGELDFFQHGDICTGKCMSRNSGVSKYDVSKFADGTVNMDLSALHNDDGSQGIKIL